MSVKFATKTPKALLELFDKRIEQKEPKGRINTWRKTGTGFYTHTSERWEKKAYFKPNLLEDGLVFNIVPKDADSKVEPEDYSFYHGHLIETFLNHFTEKFSAGRATSKPTSGDRLKGKNIK